MIDLQEFRARVEKTVADLHRDIALMESGQIKMKSKNGDEPWRDVTQDSIDRNKRIISTHELILAGVDKRLKDDVRLAKESCFASQSCSHPSMEP
jgi:hypothetical protein